MEVKITMCCFIYRYCQEWGGWVLIWDLRNLCTVFRSCCLVSMPPSFPSQPLLHQPSDFCRIPIFTWVNRNLTVVCSPQVGKLSICSYLLAIWNSYSEKCPCLLPIFRTVPFCHWISCSFYIQDINPLSMAYDSFQKVSLCPWQWKQANKSHPIKLKSGCTA